MKLRIIWNILSDNVEYDPYNSEYTGSQVGADYADSIVGAALYGESVCGGYCTTFKALCDMLDIPCIMTGNSAHAWNYVQMEDGDFVYSEMVLLK